MSFAVKRTLSKRQFRDPRSIPGLYAWYDATQGLYSAASGGSIVTANGASVGRWEDQSGNGRHIIQSNASFQPKILANGINSKNVVDFTSDVMVSQASDWGIGKNKVFAFYVLKWDSQPSYATLMGLSDTAAGYFRFYNFWDGSTYSFYNRFYTNGFNETKVATSTIGTAWHTQYVLFPRNPSANFQLRLLKNNTQIASVTASDNNIPFASDRYFGLGGEITTAGAPNGDYFDGKIAEVVLYISPRDMTATDISNITSYFNEKWGI